MYGTSINCRCQINTWMVDCAGVFGEALSPFARSWAAWINWWFSVSPEETSARRYNSLYSTVQDGLVKVGDSDSPRGRSFKDQEEEERWWQETPHTSPSFQEDSYDSPANPSEHAEQTDDAEEDPASRLRKHQLNHRRSSLTHMIEEMKDMYESGKDIQRSPQQGWPMHPSVVCQMMHWKQRALPPSQIGAQSMSVEPMGLQHRWLSSPKCRDDVWTSMSSRPGRRSPSPSWERQNASCRRFSTQAELQAADHQGQHSYRDPWLLGVAEGRIGTNETGDCKGEVRTLRCIWKLWAGHPAVSVDLRRPHTAANSKIDGETGREWMMAAFHGGRENLEGDMDVIDVPSIWHGQLPQPFRSKGPLSLAATAAGLLTQVEIGKHVALVRDFLWPLHQRLYLLHSLLMDLYMYIGCIVNYLEQHCGYVFSTARVAAPVSVSPNTCDTQQRATRTPHWRANICPNPDGWQKATERGTYQRRFSDGGDPGRTENWMVSILQMTHISRLR